MGQDFDGLMAVGDIFSSGFRIFFKSCLVARRWGLLVSFLDILLRVQTCQIKVSVLTIRFCISKSNK